MSTAHMRRNRGSWMLFPNEGYLQLSMFGTMVGCKGWGSRGRASGASTMTLMCWLQKSTHLPSAEIAGLLPRSIDVAWKECTLQCGQNWWQSVHLSFSKLLDAPNLTASCKLCCLCWIVY